MLMDINLNNLKYYILSIGNTYKEKHLKNILNNLDIKFVKPVYLY